MANFCRFYVFYCTEIHENGGNTLARPTWLNHCKFKWLSFVKIAVFTLKLPKWKKWWKMATHHTKSAALDRNLQPTNIKCILVCSLYFVTYITSYNTYKPTYYIYDAITSSTVQGGGGSFKDRKPIGEVGCCQSWMSSWLSICLSVGLFIYLSVCLCVDLSICLSNYLAIYPHIYPFDFHLSSVYLSIRASIYLNIVLSIYPSMYLSSIFLSIYLVVWLSVHLTIYLCTYLYLYLSIFNIYLFMS